MIPRRALWGALLAGGALLLAAGALAPLRHRAWVEASPGNPVQRLVLESRSLLGFRRSAWGARVEGEAAWGSAREGFFASPAAPCAVRLRAWPGFSRELSLRPSGSLQGAPLREEGGREAFRAWFVAILEAQLDSPSPAWEPAQRDCAGLLRFAFREAWGPHTEAWRARLAFPGSAVAGEPSRTEAGPWLHGFPTREGWRPFARGTFLRQFACVRLGREIAEGRPGDLIFFTRPGASHQPDHAMALVRPDVDGCPVLLYHTGPEGSGAGREPGEVRRVRLDELMHHPDPAFRPTPENPAFLGVHRWIVLAEAPDLSRS